MKRCSKCSDLKPLEGFHRCKNTADGLQSRCKECACDAARRYYQENIERQKVVKAAYQKIHSEEHRRRSLAYVRRREAEDPAFRKRRAEAQAAYRRRHPEASTEASNRAKKELSDRYVAYVLRKSSGIEPTPALIEAKRTHLRIKRLLKEMRK